MFVQRSSSPDSVRPLVVVVMCNGGKRCINSTNSSMPQHVEATVRGAGPDLPRQSDRLHVAMGRRQPLSTLPAASFGAPFSG